MRGQAATPQTFSGKIVVANWRKTTESYCQAGSEYYVLLVGNDRYPLNSMRDQPYVRNNAAFLKRQQLQLQRLVGQNLLIQGQLITRTFQQKEHCPDSTLQCPTGPITCRWIRVSQVEKMPVKSGTGL